MKTAMMVMKQTELHIALIEPEIPQNTGNIGRLTLGLGATLHLVHPLGFSIDEKAVRRAGLDYWKNVDVIEHSNIDAFNSWATDRPVFCFSTKATKSYNEVHFPNGAVLVFGPETRGLPLEMRTLYTALRIPMSPMIRSLNLSNAVAVVGYHALSTINPRFFKADG
jgi:tRNA (cytidine/uridine-2'-O-)-methyltransferase